MDQSHLDHKYFITGDTYNCPFCKRGSVTFAVVENGRFDWSNERVVYFYLIRCQSCRKVSFHLSDFLMDSTSEGRIYGLPKKTADGEVIDELDQTFFYHQPTSFFTVDSRIHKAVRSLLTEADGCAKMNYMVGASGALRKAIYEFVKDQGCEGEDYDARVSDLKSKHPQVPAEYFDAIANVKDMTDTEMHEQDGTWTPWTKQEFDYLSEAVKAALHEVYVVPDERKKKLSQLLQIKQEQIAERKQ